MSSQDQNVPEISQIYGTVLSLSRFNIGRFARAVRPDYVWQKFRMKAKRPIKLTKIVNGRPTLSISQIFGAQISNI